MARLEELEGAKVALDSVIFIYALEGNPEFCDRVLKIFEAIEQGKCQGFACDLVLAELMVKPLRAGQVEIAREYATELPKFPNLIFCSITKTAVVTAASLRGSSNERFSRCHASGNCHRSRMHGFSDQRYCFTPSQSGYRYLDACRY